MARQRSCCPGHQSLCPPHWVMGASCGWWWRCFFGVLRVCQALRLTAGRGDLSHPWHQLWLAPRVPGWPWCSVLVVGQSSGAGWEQGDLSHPWHQLGWTLQALGARWCWRWVLLVSQTCPVSRAQGYLSHPKAWLWWTLQTLGAGWCWCWALQNAGAAQTQGNHPWAWLWLAPGASWPWCRVLVMAQ